MTLFKATDAVAGLLVAAAIVTLSAPFYVAIAVVLLNR